MRVFAVLRGQAYFVREGKRKSGERACKIKPQCQAILLELPQKSHIAFEQHPQIRNVVLQASNALYADTEREA